MLHRFFHERAEVTIHFGAQTPTVGELAALRRLVPHYSNMPPAALRELVGHAGEHSLGDMPGDTARELAAEAQKIGLKFTVENTSIVGYLPFDKTTGCAWLIDDEEESKAVVESMIAAGVPVEIIEG